MDGHATVVGVQLKRPCVFSNLASTQVAPWSRALANLQLWESAPLLRPIGLEKHLQSGDSWAPAKAILSWMVLTDPLGSLCKVHPSQSPPSLHPPVISAQKFRCKVCWGWIAGSRGGAIGGTLWRMPNGTISTIYPGKEQDGCWIWPVDWSTLGR